MVNKLAFGDVQVAASAERKYAIFLKKKLQSDEIK